MGRGSSGVRQRGTELGQWAQKKANQAGDTQTSTRASLMPAISQFTNSTGYTPTQKADILGAGEDTLSSSQDVLQNKLLNQSRRTRNSAGTNAALLSSGLEGAKQKGDLARDTTKSFADEQTRQRMFGTQALSGMYNTDTDLLARLSGLPVEALNAQAGGIAKSQWPLGFGFG